MGNRPIELFLLCDFEDTALARALSIQLSLNGIVSLFGDDTDDRMLDQCQTVAVCVGESTRSMSPRVCEALKRQLNSGVFRVVAVFLSNAYIEDSAWLPKSWIHFKSEDDAAALRDLVAVARPPLQVFLCHSRTDKPAVRELHAFLVSDGFRPWLNEKDLIAGQDWS
jgi:hypothetical protein